MTDSRLPKRPFAKFGLIFALILLSAAALGFAFWKSGSTPEEWKANLAAPACRADQTNIQISANGEIWRELVRTEAFQSCCNSATQCIVGDPACLNVGQLNAVQSVVCAGTNQGPALFRCSWQNDGKILQTANGTKYCCSVTQNATGQNIPKFLTDLSSCSGGETVAVNTLAVPTTPVSEPRPLPRGPGECGTRGGNGCTANLETGENPLGEGGDLSCPNRSICVQCAPGTSWVGGLIGSCLPAQTCRTTAVGGDGCTFRVNKTEEQIGNQNAYGCSGLRNYCVACVEGNGWNGISCVALQADGRVPCATGLQWNPTILACAPPSDPAPDDDDPEDCTGNDADKCKCQRALFTVLNGGSLDVSTLPNITNVSPSNMLSGVGTQNIPVVCNAAKYLSNGNPQWFLEYFTWQEQNTHQSSEIFSQIYGPIILGPILAVLDKSKSDSDTELTAKAEKWLKAYWALSSLAASETRVSRFVPQIHGQTENLTPGENISQGLTQVVPGARTLPHTYLSFPTHSLLTFALNYKPQQVPSSLDTETGNWPLRIALMVADVAITNNHINAENVTIPAPVLGLTETERNALRRFVTSGEGFSSVQALIGNFKPVVPITFMKTADGIMSWFGSWDGGQDGFNPNPNKAGVMAARLTTNNELRILYPHADSTRRGRERGHVGRDGQRVCATAEGVTDCLDLPTGTVKYIVEWSRNGLRMLQGDPGNPGGGGSGGGGRLVPGPDNPDPGLLIPGDLHF